MIKTIFTEIVLVIIVLVVNGHASTTIPRLEPKVQTGYTFREEDLSNMCSLACAIGWDVEASSTLENQGSNTYIVNNLNNGLLENAWVEGKKGYGVGETIIFSFEKKHFEKANIEDVSFWGFNIVNGYTKNKQTWKNNSRVKSMSMHLNDKLIAYIDLVDTWELQRITFFNHIEIIYLKPGDKVTLKIEAVYPGEKYEDTALSHLEPLGAH